MQRPTILTILGVIVAVVIAWALVSFVFSALAFLIKVIVVAVVAAVVFFALQGLLSRGTSRR